MENRTAAVVPAKGIGDALLMMIASEHLRKSGYEVTTFHPLLDQMASWFPGHRFGKQAPDDFSSFSLVLFENDNSPGIQKLEQGSIFYPTYKHCKHGDLMPLDQVFHSDIPMADNIAQAIANLLHLPGVSKDNGLCPPSELVFRRHEKRVMIHPYSSQKEKNWPLEKFYKVAGALQKKGFEPVFAMSPEERLQWKGDFPAPDFPTLDALASYLYESGFLVGNDSLLGHLASNMHLPTLIIADDAKRMRLWRPAWRQGAVVTPSRLIPRRSRKKHWKLWISQNKVIKAFERLYH